LREVWFVKKVNPRPSACLSRTIRALGAPAGSTVASVIAFGSGTPAAVVSAYQARNWASGVGASACSSRPRSP
jgi:hypothetical protein